MLIHLSPWQSTKTSITLPKKTTTASPSSRRRKRSNSEAKDSNDGNSSGHDGDHDDGGILSGPRLPVAVSYVLPTSKTLLGRRKAQSSSKPTSSSDVELRSVPVVSLTSPHKVTVIGRSKVAASTTADDDDDEDEGDDNDNNDEQFPSGPNYKLNNKKNKKSQYQYKEFSTHLQYQSRPGAAGSFLPTSSSTSSCRPISAIIDPQQDRVYALQHNNTRLCCWKAWNGTGPDDADTLKVDLKSPALSLRILPITRLQSSIMYGTCQDGTVFVARVVTTMHGGSSGQSDAKLSVDYLPKSSLIPGTLEHIETVAEKESTVTENSKPGKKRKVSDVAATSSVVFYQAYGKTGDRNLTMVRHEVLVDHTSLRRGGIHSSSDEGVVKYDTLVQRTATLHLPTPKATGTEKERPTFRLARAQLVVSSVESSPTVALIYTTVNEDQGNEKGATRRTFGALLSLADCTISSAPVELHSEARQFGFGLGKLLISATNEMISFYDLITGNQLQSKSIKSLDLSSSSSNWTMISDTMNETLAILVSDHNGLRIYCSEISRGDEYREKIRAPGLLKSSSVLASAVLELSRKSRRMSAANLLDFPSVVAFEPNQDIEYSNDDPSSSAALISLNAFQRQLTDPDATSSVNKTSFLDAFGGFLSILSNDNRLETCQNTPKDKSFTKHHSLDANGEKGKNGMKVSPKTVILPTNKYVNGDHSKIHKAPKLQTIRDNTPQSFVDGSMTVVISILRLSSKSSTIDKDARIVLKTLLQSGRVSARLHLEGSFSLFESSNTRHPLFAILRVLEQPVPDCHFSPVDLITLMLRKCPDVTERQLVIMVDYMLCRATAEDVSSVLSRMKKKQSHRRTKRCDLPPPTGQKCDNGANHTMEMTEKGETADRLILDGLERVLEMVVSYAECNESMLRAALIDGLSSGDEALVLARLLSNLLMKSLGKTSSPGGDTLQRHQVIRSVCQWTATLCDVFRDDLISSTIPTTAETYLDFLMRSTKDAIRSSEALIACNDFFCLAESRSRKRRKKASKSDGSSSYYEEEDDDNIPGYSIDELIFYF